MHSHEIDEHRISIPRVGSSNLSERTITTPPNYIVFIGDSPRVTQGIKVDATPR
jgi:hypothetical protein